MYIRARVHTFVRAYVCMNICICMNICMYEYMYVCMYVCMCVRMYACMHACIYKPWGVGILVVWRSMWIVVISESDGGNKHACTHAWACTRTYTQNENFAKLCWTVTNSKILQKYVVICSCILFLPIISWLFTKLSEFYFRHSFLCIWNC